MQKALFYLFLLFINSACVRYLQYQVPTPPEYFLAPNDRTFTVMALTENETDTLIERSKREVLSTFSAKLNELTAFNVQSSTSLVRLDFEDLNQERLDSLFELNSKDVMLILTDLRAGVLPAYPTQAQLLTGINAAYYDAIIETEWRIYFRSDRSFDDLFQNSSVNFSERYPAFTTTNYEPEAGNIDRYLSEASNKTADLFAQRFLPGKWPVQSAIIDIKKFKKANELIQQRKIDESIEAYKLLANTTKRKNLAAKASYNLAVLYEFKADYEQAEYWIKNALRYNLTHRLFVAFYYDLQDRKQVYNDWQILRINP